MCVVLPHVKFHVPRKHCSRSKIVCWIIYFIHEMIAICRFHCPSLYRHIFVRGRVKLSNEKETLQPRPISLIYHYRHTHTHAKQWQKRKLTEEKKKKLSKNKSNQIKNQQQISLVESNQHLTPCLLRKLSHLFSSRFGFISLIQLLQLIHLIFSCWCLRFW